MRILLAGATGQLGHGLVDTCRRFAVDVVPVVRPVGRWNGADRIARAFSDLPDLAEHTVTGDIAAPLWGLDEPALDALAPEVDIVVNVAAETNWASSPTQLQSVNAVGAVHGLAVANALHQRHPRCGAYVHGSSIFVAGTARGAITETPLGPQRDRTPYEHSKWIAEQALCRMAADSDVAVGIARIGGLLGDSATGQTAKRNSLYLLADNPGLLGAILPTSRMGRVDMLPRDIAAQLLIDGARAVLRLASTEPQIFHVCAGETAPTLHAVLAVARYLRTTDSDIRSVVLPERLLVGVSTEVARRFALSTSLYNRVEGLRYLTINRTFERARLARFLPYPPVSITAEQIATLAFGLDDPRNCPVEFDDPIGLFT